MAGIVQIKRRVSGAALSIGTAPLVSGASGLKSGELLYDSQGNALYIGRGDDGAGNSTSVVAVGGAAAFILSTLLGAANGVATLDGTGKMPASQLPASITGAMVYQGVWNANTNSPALTSGTGTKGWYYKVSVAGSTSLEGVTNWNVGDMVVFDGVTWDKIDGPAEAVTTVAGRQGAVTLAAADITDASTAGKALLIAATLALQRAALKIDARTAVADASYSLGAADINVQMSTMTAARTLTLPSAASLNAGQALTLGDSSGGCSASNTLTIARSGSDTINGGASLILNQAYGQAVLQSDGVSKWVVISQPATTATSIDGGTI